LVLNWTKNICDVPAWIYWQHLNWEAVDSLAEVQSRLSDRTWWRLTKFATRFVWDAKLEPGHVFLFGSESNGLPPRLLEESPDSNLKTADAGTGT